MTWPVVRHSSAVIEIALDSHLRRLELFISLAIIHIRYNLGQLEVLHVSIQVLRAFEVPGVSYLCVFLVLPIDESSDQA